jgi:HD-GYP domain-containing protein (c-di-GMP phosphodiesterase class II)
MARDVMEDANHLAMAAVYLFVGLVSAALVNAAERERRGRIEADRAAQRNALVQAIATLSTALRQRDDDTGAHCERVARIAVRLGSVLALAPARLELLRLASLAHDVGKIGIRDDVLLKPHGLTPEERERIERHPAIAAELLRPSASARNRGRARHGVAASRRWSVRFGVESSG